MNSKLKYLPVHWKNGMSFSENHLNSQYLAIADSIRDASAMNLTKHNYGLLGGDGHLKFSESFRDNINNEKVEVSYCRAITQNGSRIEILDQTWEELNIPLSELIGSKNLDTSRFWYVLLIVDPFTRVPEGIEDEQESPRRKPNTRPAYQLELMSLNDLKLDNLANAIPVAKFETSGSGLRKVENYIPPCARINSHENLIKKYESCDNYLTALKESAQNIIAKIKHKRKNKENNALANDIDALCKRYLEHFVMSYDEYKLSFKDLPPIRLLWFFAKLARIMNHSMDMAYDKSHMLKYFRQYATDINAAELNKIICNTFESNYIHFDIGESLAVVDKFLETIVEIFKRLEQLDYRELAPRGVVEKDFISDSNFEQDRLTRRTPDIKIKRPGTSESLEDELE